MKYFPNRNYILLIYILIGLLVQACTNNSTEELSEVILVSINDSVTISKNEFIRRAEYTLRPPYCNNNKYIDKKIVLNSLIAEKLLALEAGPKNELTESKGFRRFVKGRKEQAMRQWMFYKEAEQRVQIDSTEIAVYYKFAGREYDVAYYPVKNNSLLNQAQKASEDRNQQFRYLFGELYGNKEIPIKQISWSEHEQFIVLKSLFRDGINKGDILEPIKINDEYYLIFKILGWRDTKIYTESQIMERWTKIADRLKRERAAHIWDKTVALLMQGKSIEFDKSVFHLVSDIFLKYYVKSEAQLNDELKARMWNENLGENKNITRDLKDIRDETFFQIEGKIWTVGDFTDELMSHPLVFRTKNISAVNFPKQFRLAVADLIRDSYITQEAYKKGYDKVKAVRREERIWRDAFLAIYQRDKYLENVTKIENFNENYLKILNSHLNSYVNDLQTKYYRKIELNIDEFEKIRLTKIDLYVQHVGVPYKQTVPGFPLLTTNHQLGYIAKRIEK
jgi:hypothetical protein